MQLYHLIIVNIGRDITEERGNMMGCSGMKYKLSLYMDGQLEKQDAESVEAHISQCPSCRDYYRSIMEIKDYCSSLEEVELPLGFHDKLWKQLYKKGEGEMLKKRRKLPIAIGLVAAALVIVIGISMVDALRPGYKYPRSGGVAYDTADAVGAGEMPAVAPEEGYYGVTGKNSTEPPDSDMDMAEVPQESYEVPKGDHIDDSYEVDEEFISSADRKIIKSAYLGIETLEFDILIDNLQGKISMMGGYIESSNIQGVPRAARDKSPSRKAHFEVRVPNNKFEQFINEVGNIGNLITKEIGGEDVTGQYFDTQARIKALTIQEERLLSILEKAERLSDIIELESELTKVRYEIEHYTGTLKRLDNMVNYSRVTLDIYEVKEITLTEPDPETLGQRMARAFKDSLQNLGKFFENLTIFLVAALPYLVIIVPLLWIVWILGVKLMRNRKDNKREENLDG